MCCLKGGSRDLNICLLLKPQRVSKSEWENSWEESKSFPLFFPSFRLLASLTAEGTLQAHS